MKVEILTGKHKGETGKVLGDANGHDQILVAVPVDGVVQKFTYSRKSVRAIEKVAECSFWPRCQQRWGVSSTYVCRWRRMENLGDCGLRKQFERGLLDEAGEDPPAPKGLEVGDAVSPRRGKYRGEVGRVVEIKDDYTPSRYLVALQVNGLPQKFTYTGAALIKKEA